MITLFRWFIYKTREVKWKLAFWQFADRQLMGIIRHPEEFERKLIDSFAKSIHGSDNR